MPDIPNDQPQFCFEIFDPASRDDAVIVDALVPRWLALRMQLLFQNAGLDRRQLAGTREAPEDSRRG